MCVCAHIRLPLASLQRLPLAARGCRPLRAAHHQSSPAHPAAAHAVQEGRGAVPRGLPPAGRRPAPGAGRRLRRRRRTRAAGGDAGPGAGAVAGHLRAGQRGQGGCGAGGAGPPAGALPGLRGSWPLQAGRARHACAPCMRLAWLLWRPHLAVGVVRLSRREEPAGWHPCRPPCRWGRCARRCSTWCGPPTPRCTPSSARTRGARPQRQAAAPVAPAGWASAYRHYPPHFAALLGSLCASPVLPGPHLALCSPSCFAESPGDAATMRSPHA